MTQDTMLKAIQELISAHTDEFAALLCDDDGSLDGEEIAVHPERGGILVGAQDARFYVGVTPLG